MVMRFASSGGFFFLRHLIHSVIAMAMMTRMVIVVIISPITAPGDGSSACLVSSGCVMSCSCVKLIGSFRIMSLSSSAFVMTSSERILLRPSGGIRLTWKLALGCVVGISASMIFLVFKLHPSGSVTISVPLALRPNRLS